MASTSGRPALVLLVSGLLMLAACADPVDPATVDLDLSAYPPCAEQPDPEPQPAVDGLVLPDSATIFTTTEIDPLTQVAGVVQMTPLQARDFYESHPGLDVISVEDERVETEVVASDGTHRMFVKVQIVCAGGSNFTAVVGDEALADQLPRPAGAQPTG